MVSPLQRFKCWYELCFAIAMRQLFMLSSFPLKSESCILNTQALGRAYRGLPGGFLLLRNFNVAISGSSCLFYLRFNFDSYVSKIMHL